MEAKEKSSSPAATAKGTAPSNCKYYSSLPPIFQVSDPQAKDEMKRGRAYDEGNQGEAYNPDYLYGGENYHKALSDVVSYVLRDCAGDGLSALSDVVVKVTNALVAWVNMSEPPSNPEAGKIYGRGFRWPKLKSIDPVQAAELVFSQEVIRMVCVKETVDKPTSEGVLAMYDPDEGIYREIGDGQIDLWCQEVVGAVNGNWKKNFVQKLHDMASRRENRVCECDNPSLNWEVLPSGDYPWERMQDDLKKVSEKSSKTAKKVLIDKCEFINSFQPDFRAYGKSGFKGYVIFGFADRNIFVLESVYPNNATYVFGKNWEELSKLTKAEILKGNLQDVRIIHNDNWQQEIRDLLEVA